MWYNGLMNSKNLPSYFDPYCPMMDTPNGEPVFSQLRRSERQFIQFQVDLAEIRPEFLFKDDGVSFQEISFA